MSSHPRRPLISLIAAVARNGAIGKGGRLLVHLPEDLRHFKRTTLGSPVVMGRKTWESIGRPLPGRRNVVVSRRSDWQAPGAERAATLESALDLAADGDAAPAKVYVIGGAELYRAALPLADELVLTEIDAELEGDVYFPEWNADEFIERSRERHVDATGLAYSFVTYQRKDQRQGGG